MLIIGIPIGIGTSILAEKIILLVFGSSYTESVIALEILIWTIVFTFGGAAFTRLLEATDKQLTLTKITGIAAIFNIFLNLVLIPEFGLIGACVSTVLQIF